MMKEQLSALYALQQVDTAMAALQKQYSELDRAQAEKTAAEAAKAAHLEAEKAFHATTTNLRDTELEQKATEAKAAEYETKLYSGSVRGAKELQSIQDEVEMLRRLVTKLDEKILVLMDDVEVQRQKEAQTKAARKQAETAFKQKAVLYKQQAETLVAQAQALKKERDLAVPPVPPALLKRYDTLRASKGGLAIAALEDGNACGGCKMGLPSRIVESVTNGATIEICDNCGRILCDPKSV